MSRRLTKGVVAALVLAGAMSAAQAQAPAVCQTIAAQIASIDSSANGDAYTQAAAVQRGEMAKITAQLRASGCGTPGEAPICGNLNSQMVTMRSNLARLEAQGARSGAGRDQGARRAQLVAAYDQNGCRSSATVNGRSAGAPPRLAATGPQTAYPAEERRPGFFEGLFGGLFGGNERPARSSAGYSSSFDPNGPDPTADASLQGGTGLGGNRAICVRLCDGGFFPAGRSSDDGGAMCGLQCPGAETQLFYMRGDDVATAVSSSGQAYTRLANAFKYKKSYDKTCSCRPQNASWADLSTRDSDPTLRQGDIVVTELQSKLMSLPADTRKSAEPALREQDRLKRESDLRRAEAAGLRPTTRDAKGRVKGQLRNDRSLALDGEVAAPAAAVAAPEPALATGADTAMAQDSEAPPRTVRVIEEGRFSPRTPPNSAKTN